MKTFRKVFSCVLVVISFILIFTSWVVLTPKVKNAAVDYYNTAFDPAEKVTSFPKVMDELEKLNLDELLGIDSVIGNISVVDSVYDESGLRPLIGALKDGGLDVTQTALAARTVRNFNNYLRGFSSLFSSENDAGFVERTALLTLYNVLAIILFILAILIAIATFLVRFMDRLKAYRKYDLAFFIIQLLLFILTIVFAATVNAKAGLGYPVLGISLWGIIAVILSCPSLLLDRIPFERISILSGNNAMMNDTATAFSSTVSRTMDILSNKVDETAQGVRLSRELKAHEDQLKDKYIELGKQFYQSNADNPPEELTESFQEIQEKQEHIASLQKDIDLVNNVVACPECGKRWTAGTKFCAECGAKLPNNTVEREEFDMEMKQKKVKKAGKSFCKYCGAKVEEDDEFCPGCGRSI